MTGRSIGAAKSGQPGTQASDATCCPIRAEESTCSATRTSLAARTGVADRGRTCGAARTGRRGVTAVVVTADIALVSVDLTTGEVVDRVEDLTYGTSRTLDGEVTRTSSPPTRVSDTSCYIHRKNRTRYVEITEHGVFTQYALWGTRHGGAVSPSGWFLLDYRGDKPPSPYVVHTPIAPEGAPRPKANLGDWVSWDAHVLTDAVAAAP